MNTLKHWIEKFIQEYKDTILQYYSKSHSYFIDLIISKGIPIDSLINHEFNDEVKSVVIPMINAINSGLITVGFNSNLLTPPHDIYEKSIAYNLKNYRNYLDLFNSNLKNYINKFLFIVLLDYIVEIDKKKLENLDLFDLVPQSFLKNIQQFKELNPISGQEIDKIKSFIKQISNYFNPSSLQFTIKNLEIIPNSNLVDESDILLKLKLAKEENLGVLKNETIKLNSVASDGTYLKQEKIKKQNDFFLFNYFQNFPKLSNNLAANFHVNFENIDNVIVKNIQQFDLEDLFYIISIYKILDRTFPIPLRLIEDIVKHFINGKVFSSGKYHIPNPISIFYGLALFSQLDIIDKSNVIDKLDIEMVLENELVCFNPQNIYLNFYTLMSLKLLQKSGGISKEKEYLLRPLLDLEVEKIKNFIPYKDLFYYITSIKLFDPNLNLKEVNQKYYKLLKALISSNGSINNNLTDTARTLLTFHILDVKTLEDDIEKQLTSYMMQYLTFFSDQEDSKFNWKTNKLALKVELRMLFWTLLAFI